MIKIQSFRYAIKGLVLALQTERHMKIHLLAIVIVSGLATITQCSSFEWSLLILSFAVVIGLELMNTAIEKTCDLVSTSYSKHIGLIKDIAAGAVLFASICTAAIGTIILLPKILKLI